MLHDGGEPRTPSVVSAVLFDADGVIQSGIRRWAADMAAVVAHVDPREHQRFADEVAIAEESVLDGHADFAGPLAEVLQRWEVGQPVADVLALWHRVDVDEQMLGTVKRLRDRGIRCAVGTNQHNERASYMRRELGYEVMFDRVFYSCELGVAKPDPRFFREVTSRWGVTESELLFVDDMVVNVEGARQAGLLAEVFAHNGSVDELERILARHGLR